MKNYYDINKKSEATAYILYFFLGWLMAHQFYLRNYKYAATTIATAIIGAGLMLVYTVMAEPVMILIGAGFLLGYGLIILYELFMIPAHVREYNRGVMRNDSGPHFTR